MRKTLFTSGMLEALAAANLIPTRQFGGAFTPHKRISRRRMKDNPLYAGSTHDRASNERQIEALRQRLAHKGITMP